MERKCVMGVRIGDGNYSGYITVLDGYAVIVLPFGIMGATMYDRLPHSSPVCSAKANLILDAADDAIAMLQEYRDDPDKED